MKNIGDELKVEIKCCVSRCESIVTPRICQIILKLKVRIPASFLISEFSYLTNGRTSKANIL